MVVGLDRGGIGEMMQPSTVDFVYRMNLLG